MAVYKITNNAARLRDAKISQMIEDLYIEDLESPTSSKDGLLSKRPLKGRNKGY